MQNLKLKSIKEMEINKYFPTKINLMCFTGESNKYLRKKEYKTHTNIFTSKKKMGNVPQLDLWGHNDPNPNIRQGSFKKRKLLNNIPDEFKLKKKIIEY